MPLADFDRYPLTFGPSPIQPLPRLSEHLGGAKIWAKRDDVNSGLAFGGNKIRKLEYLVPDILAKGADTLVPSAATSPTTPGRSPPSPPSSASRLAWCRRTGWTGRTR